MWPTVTRWVEGRKLWCPFCQAPLSFKEGELYCAAGDCGFSQHVTDLIEAGLASVRTAKPHATQLPEFTYGCPSCKSPLSFPEGRAICANCGFASPPGLHFNLTERHHHHAAP
jgi:uncharacterized Zn finger protein (UPF0148 family)